MRYAKALLDFAAGQQADSRLYDEMKSLSRCFREQPELRRVLDNPVLPKSDKMRLLAVAAAGESEPSDAYRRFMQLVLQNRRENYLQLIALIYMDLFRKRHHIGVGKLTTAIPVNEEVQDRIRKVSGQVLHATMELEVAVDPAIEGGFVFEVNHYRLDASVATRLKQVRQQYIDKNRRIV